MLKNLNAVEFKKIGIGVAFSPNLEANINEASRLALFFNSELILIHVGKETDIKNKQFKKFLEPYSKQGVKWSVIYKVGTPVQVILSTVNSENIDLLVLGALKKEKFINYYIGSIARKITRQAKCCVLLLIKPSKVRVPCNHLVVNGLKDPKTQQTISTAFMVGHKLSAKKITVVEEIGQEEVDIKVEDDRTLLKSTIIRERLTVRENQRVKKLLKQIPKTHSDGITVKSQAIFGKRGYSIGHYAQVVRADLLVMNAPVKTTLWDRIFPHDIEHILGELPTDVLIVR
jgi:nucleotide-binding universal stress UspA family protein